MEELTAIAQACLRVAVDSVPNATDLAVVGMGKLGGGELNYSSDVDVLFLHASTGGAAYETGAKAAAAVMALLSEPTEEGVALRVDASLRPEGRSGALSRSLDSMIAYYGEHAATWERQAPVSCFSACTGGGTNGGGPPGPCRPSARSPIAAT